MNITATTTSAQNGDPTRARTTLAIDERVIAAEHEEPDRHKKSRHEFKYVIDESLLPVFEEYLQRVGLRKDDAQGGTYPVTSLYFDTPFLNDYHDKVDGIRYRRKLRARAYERDLTSGGAVWLEIKEKHDMNIRKFRGTVSSTDFSELLQANVSDGLILAAKREPAIRRFLYLFLAKNYRPLNVIRYARTAFVDDFTSDIRLTLDHTIETCTWREYMDNNGRLLHPVAAGKAVIEVKFKGAMPWWSNDMIKRFRLSRAAFSKYTHAIDALVSATPLPR